MTPRERAKEPAEKIGQWFWARTATNATNCDLGEKHALEQVEQAITADRAQLQAEIERRIDESEQKTGFLTHGAVRLIIESVFSQSPSEKSKPVNLLIASHVFKPTVEPEMCHCGWPKSEHLYQIYHDAESDRLLISQEEFNRCIKQANENAAETLWQIAQSFCNGFRVINEKDSPDLEGAIKSRIDWLERRVAEMEQEHGQLLREADRRVLAEREACAEICDHQDPMDASGWSRACERLAGLIRARSNPAPEPVPHAFVFDSTKSLYEDSGPCAVCGVGYVSHPEKPKYADHLFKQAVFSEGCRYCDLPESQHAQALPFPGQPDGYIEQLHQIITKLTEEKNALQEKLETIEPAREMYVGLHRIAAGGRGCVCSVCAADRESPSN